MSQNEPHRPSDKPPAALSSGTYYPPQPPPKRKQTLRNVLLVIITICVLFIAGCMALLGLAANEVGKSIDESIEADKLPGGPDNPLTVEPGEAFEVSGFKYAAGWRLGRNALGDVDIKKLKVTNTRDDRDGAIVEIKLWRGTEVVAQADCTTSQIEPGTTVTVSCVSIDKLPKSFDKVTINDTF